MYSFIRKAGGFRPTSFSSSYIHMRVVTNINLWQPFLIFPKEICPYVFLQISLVKKNAYFLRILLLAFTIIYVFQKILQSAKVYPCDERHFFRLYVCLLVRQIYIMLCACSIVRDADFASSFEHAHIISTI